MRDSGSGWEPQRLFPIEDLLSSDMPRIGDKWWVSGVHRGKE